MCRSERENIHVTMRARNHRTIFCSIARSIKYLERHNHVSEQVQEKKRKIETRRPSVNFLPSKNSSLAHRRYMEEIFQLMGMVSLFSSPFSPFCSSSLRYACMWECVYVFLFVIISCQQYSGCIRCVCFYSIPFITWVLNFLTKFSFSLSLVSLRIWLLLHLFTVRLSFYCIFSSSFQENILLGMKNGVYFIC